MNHTVYRHLSIPWLVKRDGLRFMPEGSGKFEVGGHAGTMRRLWWSGLCGTDCWMTSDTDCFRRLAAGAHCGEATGSTDLEPKLPGGVVARAEAATLQRAVFQSRRVPV